MAQLTSHTWILGTIGSAGLVALGVACGADDGNALPVATTGGMSASGGATGGATTGGSSSGGAPAAGGSATGGSATTGGGGSTGGSGAGALGDELVNAEGWIGGVPDDRTDDAHGLQGSYYQYGDDITCLTSTGNPCAAAGCCIDWKTIVDKPDYASWGCGIGLELNSDGAETPTKMPYAGTEVVGFQVTVAGDVPKVRLGFTQLPNTDGIVSPYAQEVSGPGTYEVLFSEATCPSWGAEQGCTADSVATSSHDLQVQVVGGDEAGVGSLCVTSVRPILAQ